MEFVNSILTFLVWWSGFLTICMFGGLMGYARTDSRSKAIVDNIVNNGKEPTIMYWLNLGYQKLLQHYLHIFVILIAIFLISSFMLHQLNLHK